jgi:hypothetical protein
LILAPFCNNHFTTSKLPKLDEFINAVRPFLSYSIKKKSYKTHIRRTKRRKEERIDNHFLKFMFFFIYLSFFLSFFLFHFCFLPSLTLSSILAPFCSNTFIISKWPQLDAWINEVHPLLFYSIKNNQTRIIQHIHSIKNRNETKQRHDQI